MIRHRLGQGEDVPKRLQTTKPIYHFFEANQLGHGDALMRPCYLLQINSLLKISASRGKQEVLLRDLQLNLCKITKDSIAGHAGKQEVLLRDLQLNLW